jgi:hypothetical protein
MIRPARALVVALGLVLSHGTILAQPAPPPDPNPNEKPEKPNVGEKANNDNLQQGNEEERPWAKGVSKDRQDAALRAFSEANKHLNKGLFVAALEKYKEALKSWEHPAIYYNMALAQMNLDQPIEVEKSLTKAIAYGPKPLEKDKFEHAQQYLLINAKQLAWIDVSCKKIGANVFIDDEKVFTVTEGQPNRVERRVKIGKHTIVAERTGYNAQVDAPMIGPGQKFAIELQLYTSDELTRYKRRWNATWMPYAVIGAGVAVGAFGIVMSGSAQSSYDQFDDAIARCNDDAMGGGCVTDSSITKLRDSGDSKKTIAYVGYGVAGAAVVTGGVLVYLNRRRSYEITADEYRKELSAKKRAARSAQVLPLVTPDTAGAMVLGRF